MDTISQPSSSKELRVCEVCGALHDWRNSPTCRKCRRKNSKKNCPVEGCSNFVDLRATTCLMHRHLKKNFLYTECQECHTPFPPQSHPACKQCQQSTFLLCACGCGKYRRKYNTIGLAGAFITGHRVENQEKHRIVHCANCGKAFDTTSPFAKLCSQTCVTEWMSRNPPHGQRRVHCTCSICGKEIYKTPSSIRNNNMVTCSRTCQYIAVANQLKKDSSVPKARVLRRDRAACCICGFDVLVEVHHIKPRRENGPDEEWNLITLCPNHHTMADRKLISREELYQYVEKAGSVANQ